MNYFNGDGKRGRYFVQTERSWKILNYPKKRTREHFMTVGLARDPDADAIELTVNAWLVRESARRRGLPGKSFRSPFRTMLK